MQYELSQTFYFEAAHTLRRTVDVEPSLRIHGHTYIAEITLAGAPDADAWTRARVAVGGLLALRRRIGRQLWIAALLLVLWVVSGPVCGISGVTVEGYTGTDRAAVQQTAELVAGTGSMANTRLCGSLARCAVMIPMLAPISSIALFGPIMERK